MAPVATWMPVRKRQMPPKKYQNDRPCSGTSFFRAKPSSDDMRKRSSRNSQTARAAFLAISASPRDDDVVAGDRDGEALERPRRRAGEDVAAEVETAVVARA